MKDQTQIREISCQGRTIEYELTRKKVKNINLRIKPEGKVCVSASRADSVRYLMNLWLPNRNLSFKH